MQTLPLSIYIHWPYCKSKCPYCDFFKQVQPHVVQEDLIGQYISELRLYRRFLPDRAVRSVFFGGGTPSLLKPSLIECILNEIAHLWPMEQSPEISLEANPNSEYPHMFADLKTAGINRLSLGVQALNEADLRFLGRTHTLDQALHAIDEVVRTFDNHSIDLIYARPQQTPDHWLAELQRAVSFGLKHLSLYQLTIEDGTVFAKKGIRPADDDTAVDLLRLTLSTLREAGYPRYEVSNFAPKEFESCHNKCYWQGGDYIGIGPSAHGRLRLKGKHYAIVHPHRFELISTQDRAIELLLMGLRLQEGINKHNFYHICGLNFNDFINQKNLFELQTNGYIIDSPTFCRATDLGFEVLNQVIEELCPDTPF